MWRRLGRPASQHSQRLCLSLASAAASKLPAGAASWQLLTASRPCVRWPHSLSSWSQQRGFAAGDDGSSDEDTEPPTDADDADLDEPEVEDFDEAPPEEHGLASTSGSPRAASLAAEPEVLHWQGEHPLQRMIHGTFGGEDSTLGDGSIQGLDGVKDDPSVPRDQAFMERLDKATGKARKRMLQRAISGRDNVFGEPEFADEHDPVELATEEWMTEFHSTLVDVNAVSKGTRTGGIRRFTALAVIGNYDGTIGLGVGKASEVQAAVAKADKQALKSLFFVPRYQGATIHQLRKVKYGRALVIVYPRSSGSGIKACPWIETVCTLAGISDIGVKIHGTRNKRNIAKALVLALEGQELPEDVYARQAEQLQQTIAAEVSQQGSLPEHISRRGNLMIGRTLGAAAGSPLQQQQQL